MEGEATVVQVPEEGRFVVEVDGERAGFTEYVRQGDRYVFLHTEIDDRFEGRGLGSTLVQESLDAVRDEGATVFPSCPFVAGWIERHPEYDAIVDLTDPPIR